MKIGDKLKERYLEGPYKTAFTIGLLGLFVALIALTVAVGATRAN